MNTIGLPPSRSRVRLLPVLGALFAFWVVLFAIGALWVLSSLRLSSDARALRNSLFAASTASWSKTIEVNLGWLAVTTARTGLRFARLDPKARIALESPRAGQIGIYELRDGRRRADRAALLSAADRVMANRGWDRLVGVLEPETMVAVYVRKGVSSPQNMAVCFAVIDHERMVVGSVRSDLEPLMQLARQEIEKQKRRAPLEFSAVFR